MMRLLSLLILLLGVAGPVWAGLPLSLNFRGTTAFVTDGGGETAIPSESETSGTAGWAYPHTFSGISMGWTTNVGTAQFDRSVTPAAKFAGLASNNTNGSNTFRIDLPNGTYNIAFAAGSYTALTWSATWTIVFKDNASTLFTLSTIPNSGGNSFTDHNNALKTDSTWSNASPVQVTITSGILNIVIGDGSNSFSGAISHLEISAVSSDETFGFYHRRGQ